MDLLRNLEQELFAALGEMPLFDVHTHLVGGSLGARGLHDILLYHMAVSELYSAGCPDGARLTQYPGWPDTAEAHARIEAALPYLAKTRNTSIAWAVRTILADLYGWTEPVDADNWKRLDGLVRERAEDADWPRDTLRSLHIKRVGTEWSRREAGQDDDILDYALEWGFFTRCQWGEYDTALYELERCWGQAPGTASPIGGGERPKPAREIRSAADAAEAVQGYVDAIAALPVRATATHISTDLDLSWDNWDAAEGRFAAALERRAEAGPAERSVYAAYINELFLSRLEETAPHVVFQFSFAAEPLPYETGSRLRQETVAWIAAMIGRHPNLHFQCSLASRHANQALCTLCRELPNFSLSGYWWHNFFPSVIRQIMDERLDMVPLNRQIGFFSDAYCVEWIYGKALIVRHCLAVELAKRIARGQYHFDDAIAVAREILYETPRELLGFAPSGAL